MITHSHPFRCYGGSTGAQYGSYIRPVFRHIQIQFIVSTLLF